MRRRLDEGRDADLIKAPHSLGEVETGPHVAPVEIEEHGFLGPSSLLPEERFDVKVMAGFVWSGRLRAQPRMALIGRNPPPTNPQTQP